MSTFYRRIARVFNLLTLAVIVAIAIALGKAVL